MFSQDVSSTSFANHADFSFTSPIPLPLGSSLHIKVGKSEIRLLNDFPRHLTRHSRHRHLAASVSTHGPLQRALSQPMKHSSWRRQMGWDRNSNSDYDLQLETGWSQWYLLSDLYNHFFLIIYIIVEYILSINHHDNLISRFIIYCNDCRWCMPIWWYHDDHDDTQNHDGCHSQAEVLVPLSAGVPRSQLQAFRLTIGNPAVSPPVNVWTFLAIWMSFTKHMNFPTRSYDMSIFGEFYLASWKSFPRLEAMELEANPRLEAKSENTTLALDRAIAGFLVRSSFNISYLVPWKRWIHWKFHMILCGVMAFLMAMVIPTVVSMVILGRQSSFVDVWNRTSWIFLTSVCQATKVK